MVGYCVHIDCFILAQCIIDRTKDKLDVLLVHTWVSSTVDRGDT